MPRLTAESFRRPADLSDPRDPAVLYVRSYLLIRTLVGLVGILLPVALFAGEAAFVRGPVWVRDSLSAYYHTPMQDVFVGGLSVVAFLLLAYLAAQPWTWDFWLSSLAGVALLVVVFFPIGRSGLPPGAPRCGSAPEPAGCSPTEQLFGEQPVASVHIAASAVFILSLAALCFLFARRVAQHDRDRRTAAFETGCGVLILVAVAWIAVGSATGSRLGPLSATYSGEVACIWSFGAAWLVRGLDLRRLLLPRRRRPAREWGTGDPMPL